MIDTGWSREVSPSGEYDRMAQIRHMSFPLYVTNQGEIARGKAVNEQLQTLGIYPENLDYVLLTHLDCDHASGVKQVKKQSIFLCRKMKLPVLGGILSDTGLLCGKVFPYPVSLF